MNDLIAGTVQELRFLLRGPGVVGRHQHDPPCAERIERVADRGRGGESARRAAAPERGEHALLAIQSLAHRVRGAMERHHVALRVGQRSRGVLDARQELIERHMMRTGHAQPRHVRLHPGRDVAHHLLLDHPVRRRNDQADAPRSGHASFPWRMIWSENPPPLFGIMRAASRGCRRARAAAAPRRRRTAAP